MKRQWTRLAIAGAALVIAVAAGTSAWAMTRDADDRPSITDSRHEDAAGGDGLAGACLEGSTDCVDDPSEDGAAGNACLVGSPDCGDDPSRDGGNALGVCVEGVVDCVDTVVDPGGEVPCPETGCEAVPPIYECPPDMACIEPWLMDPPVCPEGVSKEECFPDCVQPLPAPAFETAPDCEPAAPPANGELPPDCAVSSDGAVYCPDGSGDSSGEGSAPGSPGVVDGGGAGAE